MRLGLVLSGGGAKGAFEAGVAAALEEAGLRPAILSGTSAGALNAAGLAAGFDAAQLAELWTSTTDRDVYVVRRDLARLLRFDQLLGADATSLFERVLESIGWTWLLDTAPLRATLTAALGGETVPVRPDVVLTVSAVEVASGEVVRFTSAAPPTHRADPRFRVVDVGVDHLLASAAIPLLFKPGSVDAATYWDGGIVANTPLAPALAYEPDAVIVVTTSTLRRPAPEPTSLAQALSLLLDNLLRYSLVSDLARAETVNALCAAAPEAVPSKRVVDFLVIEPTDVELPGSAFLRFDPAQAARLIAIGHELGAAAIADWQTQGRLPT
jgi:NTE family protein